MQKQNFGKKRVQSQNKKFLVSKRVRTLQTKPHCGRLTIETDARLKNPNHIYRFWPVCRSEHSPQKIEKSVKIFLTFYGRNTDNCNEMLDASVLSTAGPGTLPRIKFELPGTRM